MNKSELLNALKMEQQHMSKTIADLSDEAMETPGVIPGWSVKDILVHLTLWEAELVKLLWQASQGIKPTTIHFRDVSVDETNERWHEENKTRPLERILVDFNGVRKQTIRRVENFPEKALTDPDHYPWLGGTPLWKWIAIDTFEHEAEHISQIESWKKAEQQ
jgi:hypothetical protein